MVKNLPTNTGDAGSIPGSGKSPGGGNGNPSSILAWEIPWTEEPGRLQVPGVTTAHLSKNAPGLQYTKLGAFWLQFFKLTSLQAEEQPYQVPSALP